MKLYEIANEYLELLEAIEGGEIPEEAIGDTLESIVALLEDKADSIACMVKNLSAEAAAIKVEEDTLKARRKAKERQAEWFKTYLADILQRSGCTKLETARVKLSFRKSESVTIDDEAAFIAWAQKHNDSLLTYSAPTISKTAVKDALASGAAIEGARIETRQNIQIK